MSADPVLTVLVLDRGTTVEVLLAGDLDTEAEDQLRAVVTRILIDPQVRLIEVDMSLVGFCDSSGLTGLIRARNQADGYGVALRLARVGPRLRRLLDLTGLWDAFDGTGAEDAP